MGKRKPAVKVTRDEVIVGDGRRVLRASTNLLGALAKAAERYAGQRYCRNCGDPFDVNAENAAVREPSGSWRPCPNPSPGRPMIDSGVGGHMYTDQNPRID